MKALLLDAENRTATVSDLPLPVPGPNELLIAVKALGLNAVDALYTRTPLGSTGRVVGSDFAGIVVARGPPLPCTSTDTTSPSGVPSLLRRSSTILSSSINRGDRVAGFLQGACSLNDRPGAFAEYVVCPADLVWRISPHVTFEEAAGMSLCSLTAAQGLFFRLGLEAPFEWDDESDEGVLRRAESEASRAGEQDGGELSFLVAGASTSVGMYVAQLVRRSAEVSGKRVKLIGTASPRNWDRLRAEPYGFKHLLDYRDASWPDQVRQASGGGVHFAYDAISEGSTVKDVSSALGEGGKIAVVRSKEAGAWQAETLKTEPIYGAVWEGLGQDIQYHKFVVKSSPAKRSFAMAFYKWLSDGGLLKPNPIRIMPGGLDRVVQDGFSLLGASVSKRNHEATEEHMRPISGEKLVYTIEAERAGGTGEGHTD